MWNCPSLQVLSDGTIVLLLDCSAHGNTLENARPPHDILMFTSDDNGESWSGPTAIAPVGMCPDKLQVLPSGRWLLATHQWSAKGGRPRIVQYAWASDDAGATWQGPFEVGSHPDYHLCEASVVQHPDGPLVAYIRENSYLGVPMFKSISRDEGKTWELMETNILGGHRPKCGFLRNGKMMTLYRFCISSRVKESCFCAFIEPAESVLEENRLAQRGRMIPLVQDFHDDPDLGYSGWVEFPDGEVVVVSYMRGSNHAGYVFGFGVSPERMEMLSSSA
jgi:sialidase-1